MIHTSYYNKGQYNIMWLKITMSKFISQISFDLTKDTLPHTSKMIIDVPKGMSHYKDALFPKLEFFM